MGNNFSGTSLLFQFSIRSSAATVPIFPSRSSYQYAAYLLMYPLRLLLVKCIRCMLPWNRNPRQTWESWLPSTASFFPVSFSVPAWRKRNNGIGIRSLSVSCAFHPVVVRGCVDTVSVCILSLARLRWLSHAGHKWSLYALPRYISDCKEYSKCNKESKAQE